MHTVGSLDCAHSRVLGGWVYWVGGTAGGYANVPRTLYPNYIPFPLILYGVPFPLVFGVVLCANLMHVDDHICVAFAMQCK